jgi:demethylmenaquinone methyltransferase/2-methoxy-6-polyprenyl-1,4-benzoquinol methylase
MTKPVEETKDPDQIEAMFSRIASRYDLTNRIMSLGFDMIWRYRAVQMANPPNDAKVLDMGCGTADMMAIVMKRKRFHGHLVGVDLSEPMLNYAEKKLTRIRTKATYELRQGNALTMGDADGTYDLVMTCFGARSFSDLSLGFSEVSRLLKRGGRFLVVEFFAIDKEPWIVRLYLRYILPYLGGLVSGGRFAYIYLSRSKVHFVTVDGLIALGAECNLKVVARRPLTLGVANIVVFEKL